MTTPKAPPPTEGCAACAALRQERDGERGSHQSKVRAHRKAAVEAIEKAQLLADSRSDALARADRAEAELAVEKARADRLYADRYALLGVRTTEGLGAAEWMMRTAHAEQARRDAEATVERLLDDAETVVWELVLIEQDGTDELRPPRGGSLGWYCANGAIEVLKALRATAQPQPTAAKAGP